VISVCPSSASGVPCSPLASIYTDASLAPQFLIVGNGSSFRTDGMGNYGFFAASGQTCIITITGSGLTGYAKTWVAPLVAGGNATFNALTTTLGSAGCSPIPQYTVYAKVVF